MFLQFISDGSGWLGTVFILFWKSSDLPLGVRLHGGAADTHECVLYVGVAKGRCFCCLWELGRGESEFEKNRDGLEEAADDTLRLNGRGIAAFGFRKVPDALKPCSSA